MPKSSKIGPDMRPNVYLKYGLMKRYNFNYRQWVESRIYGRTSQRKLTTADTSTQHRNAKPKFTNNSSCNELKIEQILTILSPC